MALATRASGWMISNMATGKSSGRTAQYMKASTLPVRSTAKVFTVGTTALGTMVNGRRIRLRDSEPTPGLMVASTRVNGSIIIWTV
jgi:hypothetical protein